eukprot:scaffold14608_cov101-Isochrysis_galbana.AAC.2
MPLFKSGSFMISMPFCSPTSLRDSERESADRAASTGEGAARVGRCLVPDCPSSHRHARTSFPGSRQKRIGHSTRLAPVKTCRHVRLAAALDRRRHAHVHGGEASRRSVGWMRHPTLPCAGED